MRPDVVHSAATANAALAIIELLRPNQWAKNVFVLAPLFFGATLLDRSAVVRTSAAFVIFCMSASAVYIFNDWRDVEADRHHAIKKNRPLPSGRVSIPLALGLVPILLAASVALANYARLPSSFLAVWFIYIIINASYSLGLKQISVLELFLVSSGFILRLLAGGYAGHIEESQWIIVATMSLSLLIVVGKRRSDIARENDTRNMRQSLKGYSLGYLDAVLSALSGGTLVVYLLFCASSDTTRRYGPIVLLTALPVAGGVLRYLQLVMVYNTGDSPTDLVLKDKGLILSLVTFVAIFAVLIYLK